MEIAELTDAERLLQKAFPRGDWADAGGAEIRAEVLRGLLLGAVGPEAGYAAGIRLRRAVVTGSVDLKGGAVTCPLICEECRFEGDLTFVDCRARTIALVNSELSGFNGTRMRLDGILDLTGSAVEGAVVAPGLSVEGDVDCTGLTARGPVSFEAAAVTGTVSLTGARISCPGQRALNLNYATIGGKLTGRRLTVEGETRANNCRITSQLVMDAARLENPGGIAFFAGGLEVSAGVFCRSGFTARGEFRLIGAKLGANLTVEGADFANPGAVALNLERVSVQSLNGDGLSCTGCLSMTSMTVRGDASMAGASVTETGGVRAALAAERAQIGGTLVLSDAKVSGEVNLQSVRVGERLVLDRAELRDPRGMACRLTRAEVAADVICDQMTADGELRLAGATVGGVIVLEGARLDNGAAKAVYARSLRALSLRLHAAAIGGGVDLRYATITELHDDPGTWPREMYLDGLTYQALNPQLPAAERLSWLNRDPRGYYSQPYEQLAAHYSAIGQAAQARRVLYARERIQRHGKRAAAKAWGWFQDVTVGYGYRPLRALAWFTLLFAAGSAVFSAAPPPALQTSAGLHFNGVVYTLDLMLPVVNLGQKYSFNPVGAEQWLSYFLMAAGWILATTVAAGAARVLRR